MQYLITGERSITGHNVTPDEIKQVLNKGLILDLEIFYRLGFKNKVYANGTPKKKVGVAIVHGDSVNDIRKSLIKLPFLFNINWKVSPLELA
jgi:hypothetical protein